MKCLCVQKNQKVLHYQFVMLLDGVNAESPSTTVEKPNTVKLLLMMLGVDAESPSTTAEKPNTLNKAYIIITERKKGTVWSTSFTRLKTHIYDDLQHLTSSTKKWHYILSDTKNMLFFIRVCR